MWNGDDMSGQSLVRGSDTREKRKKKKIFITNYGRKWIHNIH